MKASIAAVIYNSFFKKNHAFKTNWVNKAILPDLCQEYVQFSCEKHPLPQQSTQPVKDWEEADRLWFPLVLGVLFIFTDSPVFVVLNRFWLSCLSCLALFLNWDVQAYPQALKQEHS